MKKKVNFKSRVLAIVRKIPPGKTLSYKQVASLAGSSRAARAAGNIMANNFDERVPCHRVIKSDGKLGSYNRGGKKAKRRILAKEGAL